MKLSIYSMTLRDRENKWHLRIFHNVHCISFYLSHFAAVKESVVGMSCYFLIFLLNQILSVTNVAMNNQDTTLQERIPAVAEATEGSQPCLESPGSEGHCRSSLVAEPLLFGLVALYFLRQAVLCLLSKSYGSKTKNCLLNKQSGVPLFKNALLILVKSIGLLLAKAS